MVAEDSKSPLWVFINSDLVQNVRSFITFNLALGARTHSPPTTTTLHIGNIVHTNVLCAILKMLSQ